ncbi:MAG: hypothetical protein L0Z07_01275, partial [Planctomycetes bacterium]|nr:hypothetical protein [Planctomycetota bacterium]
GVRLHVGLVEMHHSSLEVLIYETIVTSFGGNAVNTLSSAGSNGRMSSMSFNVARSTMTAVGKLTRSLLHQSSRRNRCLVGSS